MNKDLDRLIRYIRTEDVALFIGSGFSIKAGAPSVSIIIDAILHEGGKDFTNDFSEKDRTLRKVSEAFINECNGRNELMCLLKKLFEFIPKDTSDQELLRKIPHFRQIFTTNYDTLIEDAYQLSERNLITTNEGCAYTSQNRVSIYKIHGDISTLNNPDSIIISESDYQHYFKNNRFNLIWEELKQAFIKKHIVFIGYSLEDDNVLEIIKKVRTSINNNMKGLFLIAPNVRSKAKIEQLKKNSVTYIDGKAENVLGDILTRLKETVVDDFRHKMVSKETYDAFLSLNANLYTTTTNLEKKNVIENVKTNNGVEREEKIQFTITHNIKEKIWEQLSNDRLPVKGTNLTIPAYKLTADDMISFSHTINGIVFNSKENISSLAFAPSFEQMKMAIKMKSIDFSERVNAIRYRKGNIVHIDFEVSICKIKIEIDPLGEKINIHFNSKETYTNNDDAIKWINFIIRTFSGNEFYLDKFKLNTENKIVKDVTELLMAKRYYEVIRALEHERDIEFDVYDNYNKNNLSNALCLYHYYNSTGYEMVIPKESTLSFEIDTRDERNIPIDKFDKERFAMIQSLPFGAFKLNGKEFYIPFKNLYFANCKAESIKRIDENIYRIEMKSQDISCQVWCSDYQPEQIGNKMYLGNNRD